VEVQLAQMASQTSAMLAKLSVLSVVRPAEERRVKICSDVGDEGH
jgi:hypothetical protein